MNKSKPLPMKQQPAHHPKNKKVNLVYTPPLTHPKMSPTPNPTPQTRAPAAALVTATSLQVLFRRQLPLDTCLVPPSSSHPRFARREKKKKTPLRWNKHNQPTQVGRQPNLMTLHVVMRVTRKTTQRCGMAAGVSCGIQE